MRKAQNIRLTGIRLPSYAGDGQHKKWFLCGQDNLSSLAGALPMTMRRLSVQSMAEANVLFPFASRGLQRPEGLFARCSQMAVKQLSLSPGEP